jgi:hypothetical protein
VSVSSPEKLAEYLTEEDWRTIQSSFDPKAEQPLASRQFVRAQELMDGGHLAEAVIQAVTGIELAIEYFARSRGVDTVAAQQFFDLPIKVQLAILAAGLVAPTTLDKAVRAIELRNGIVHEGIRPERDPTESLVGELTKCGQALLGTSRFKTPELNLGNRLSPA